MDGTLNVTIESFSVFQNIDIDIINLRIEVYINNSYETKQEKGGYR